MSFKNPRNLIVVVSVVAALMAGTVLLGGYANSKPVVNEAPAKAGMTSSGCCPMMAQTASCPKMADQAESTACDMKPCATECPKPCCVEEGCCETPCPIPCPKPCCEEGGCCVQAEKPDCCPMTAAE